MASMGETLTTKAGPLPVWAWAALGTAGVAYYLHRKNQAAQQQQAQQQQATAGASNLGATPVSSLTTQAMPMPLTLGDTFVNTAQPQGQTPTVGSTTGVPGTTVVTNNPAAQSLAPAAAPGPPSVTVPQTGG